MSYLSNIVQYARNVGSITFHNNIYMGNDINAIDTAYSDTENHKLSAFFVPAETAITNDESGVFVDTNYFNIYIFVPIEDDVSATDGWEEAKTAAEMIRSGLRTKYFSGSNIKYISEREFRVGRGYYIYLLSCSIDMPKSNPTCFQTITYFKYTGETNGSATYDTTVISNCSIDENYAISRMVNGTYRAYGCSVVIGLSLEINPTHKDWFVIGNYIGEHNKPAAIANSNRVYEVNEWKIYSKDNGERMGIRIVGA